MNNNSYTKYEDTDVDIQGAAKVIPLIFQFVVGGVTEWPLQSPDLVLSDLVLWGVQKGLVYRLKPKSVPELKQGNSDKSSEINVAMCQMISRSVSDCVHRCM